MDYKLKHDRRAYQNERREHQRARINLAVTFHIESPEVLHKLLGKGEFEATTLDLSTAGLTLLTEWPIPMWAKIIMKIVLYKYDDKGIISVYEPIEVAGIVRSSFASGTNAYRLGVGFMHIRQENDELMSFVNARLRHPA
ncbi:PilZ domain-containing protein [Candidatus Omnitrophota bacterium]